jgi:hypothetical protein
MNDSEIWGFLHDGSIERIDGVVPGDIRIHVSIEYLRKAFSPEGDTFILTLNNCSRFELEDDLGPTFTDLQLIAGRGPEILSVVTDDPLAVYTTFGTLQISYSSLSIALDTGQEISVQELDQASASYWDEWSRSHGDNT